MKLNKGDLERLGERFERLAKAQGFDTLRVRNPKGVVIIMIPDNNLAPTNDVTEQFKAWLAAQQPTANKYHRQLNGSTVDVYDVLKAFNVTCPALQHLIKKALCCGLRGHKNQSQDLQDILDSAKRAKELHGE